MKYGIIAVLLLVLAACGTDKGQITDSKDYEKYLANDAMETTSKYFELWNSKIKTDSLQLMSFGHVASEYQRYFKGTGNIEYLKKAEKALEKAVEIAAVNKAGYYRALSRNYISQHRFKEALKMAEAASELGSGKKESQNLLFDVHIELGNYPLAQQYLDSISDMSDFGFLIRIAKWSDYKGDLNSTIRFMEKAMAKAESAKNKNLMSWSYTNLADYYGHAGRIKDSYQHYLKALELNAQDAYAKKGIAWIVYSHEKNGKEALRILDSVTKSNQSPDHYLLKAEIAEFMGNDDLKYLNLDTYFKTVGNDAYGDMYNAYNAELYLNELGQNEKAMILAQKEVENRQTPETYSLLAQSYLDAGNVTRALEITEKYVVDKTFEPAILLNLAKIYRASGQIEKVGMLKHELTGAIYELGPLSKAEIADL